MWCLVLRSFVSPLPRTVLYLCRRAKLAGIAGMYPYRLEVRPVIMITLAAIFVPDIFLGTGLLTSAEEVRA